MIDSRSEKGQRHLARVRHAVSLLLRASPDMKFLPPGHELTRLDGLMHRDGMVVAFIEGKDRECSYEKLRREYRNEIILSRDKLDAALAIYDILGFPTIGVWIFTCNTIASQWIVRANGEPYERMREARTLTRANCNNNELVYRDNCYISLATARFLPPDEEPDDAPLPDAA